MQFLSINDVHSFTFLASSEIKNVIARRRVSWPAGGNSTDRESPCMCLTDDKHVALSYVSCF